MHPPHVVNTNKISNHKSLLFRRKFKIGIFTLVETSPVPFVHCPPHKRRWKVDEEVRHKMLPTRVGTYVSCITNRIYTQQTNTSLPSLLVDYYANPTRRLHFHIFYTELLEKTPCWKIYFGKNWTVSLRLAK